MREGTEETMCVDGDLILPDCDATDGEEVISRLCARMSAHGLVADGFREAVLARERRFPTGLALAGCGIAIPHADPGLVRRPGLAVAIMREGVSFCRMDDADREVEARLVFLIALAEPHTHLDVLRRIVRMCGERDLVGALTGAGSQADALDLIKDNLMGDAL